MSKNTDVLNFVIQYKLEHNGNSPSYEQIMEACGVLSKSHVKSILEKLEQADLLKREGTRNIAIPHSRWIQEAE